MWFTVAGVVLAIGCGGKGGPVLPVNGIVTMDDKPLDEATVTFHPEEQGIASGTARTGSDGKFVIKGVKGANGLAPGKYKVTVSKMKLPGGGGPDDPPPVAAVTEADIQNDLPAIYSHPAHTILAYTVTGDGKPIEIKLDSKRKK